MPSKSKFTRDNDGNVAVRIVSNTGVSEQPDSMFTTDEGGNVAVRVVFGEGGGGGGGGDSHNLGYYQTPEALRTAHPTATAGDFAIVNSTDTVWLWDTDTSSWKDGDTKGQVTSVNNQTGAVTVQETLVSGTNIKTVDGNSLLGSGNLELSTYLTYPNTWTTTGTTKAFCDDIAADTTATVGKAYLGEVTLSDLPASMANGEVVVEIMKGTTALDKVIVLSLKSGNVSPYAWQYVYWNNGSNVSGWKTWQETLVSGVNIKTINGTSLLGSGNITTEAIQVSTMPTAGVDELGKVYQFIGTTDANYTHGYFYECVSDGQTPATYSWEEVQLGGGGSSYTAGTGIDITGGVISVTAPTLQNKSVKSDSYSLVIQGKGNANTEPRGGYSIIIGNSIAGATNYGGLSSPTLAIGNNISCGMYNTGIYMLPLGGTAGDGIMISKYQATNNSNKTAGILLATGTNPSIGNSKGASSILVTSADNSKLNANNTTFINCGKSSQTVTEDNTFWWANSVDNYKIIDTDGTIPADRLASTTGLADGNYRLRLTMASGVPTLSWVAE